MPKLSDRIGQFTTVPNSFIEASSQLSSHAFRLFVVLRYFTNKTSGEAFPKYETLRRLTGLHKRNIAEAVRELEKIGWIERRRRFSQSTVYVLKIPSGTAISTPIGTNGEIAISTTVGTDISSTGGTDISSNGGHTNQIDINQTDSNQTDERAHARANSPTIAIPAELRNQPAPPRKQRESKPHEPTEIERLRSNASVACYYETFGRWPDKLQARAIVEVATDAPKFSSVCSEWAMKGYKATNVAGILDVYQHGWRIAVPAAQWPKRGETGRERATNGSTSRNGKTWRRPQVEYSEEDRARAYEEARKRLADTTEGKAKI